MFVKNTQCRHCQQAKLMINHTQTKTEKTVCVSQTACGRLAMRQWMCRHRRNPHAIPHSGPFQGSTDSSKIRLYPSNDGREEMRFLRHPPCPPGPLLPSTAESLKDADNGWHDLTVSPSRACSPTSR